VGGLLSTVVPGMKFPAKVPAKDLSSDPKVVEAAENDPLMKTYATVGVINGILAAGDWLAAEGWKHWPSSLPLLMVHGTEDHVVSYEAAKRFCEQVPLSEGDKTFDSFEGAFHEVHNEPKWWKKDVDDVIQFMKDNLNRREAKL